MHRLTRLLILATFMVCWLGCRQARADFIAATGGHGPSSCSTPIKDYGQIETWDHYQGACERWTGDIGAASTTLTPTAGKRWFVTSPYGTTATACMAIHQDVHGTWCTSWQPIGTGWVDLGATPYYVLVGYTPPCSTTAASSFTTVHWCTGNYTPMDAAQMLTAVIADGHVAPGLPYGNPLKLSDADVCIATWSNYPNLPAWTPFTGYTWASPPQVAAVYTCP